MKDALRELRSARVSTQVSSPGVRRVRLGLAVLWVVGLIVWTVAKGPPLGLRDLLLWLALAMFVASVGNPLGWAKSMALDWLPLYVILVGYNIVWGLVDNASTAPHVQPQLAFDQALFGDRGPVDILQDWFWDGRVDVLDYAIWVVYMSHFVVTLALCAWLWIRAHKDFLAYRRRVVTIWFTGLVVFALYPTVPPWMAADQGLIPGLTRIVGEVNRALAPTQTREVLSDGGGKIELSNPVAAVPSMHSALPMLVLLFFWNRAPRARPLLVLYPLAMTFTLVYAGEHYLFDVLAGWACAALVHHLVTRVERARSARRSTKADAEPEPEREQLAEVV